mgnify:CR=1 FL=1
MAGWRLGYVAAAPDLMRQMAKVQQHILNCATSFVQSATLTALDCEADVSRMCQEYAERRQYFVQALNEIPCITCRAPQGAFYVLPQIDYRGMDSLALSEYLLKEGHVDGSTGAMPSAGALKNCIRMPFAASMEVLQERFAACSVSCNKKERKVNSWYALLVPSSGWEKI